MPEYFILINEKKNVKKIPSTTKKIVLCKIAKTLF